MKIKQTLALGLCGLAINSLVCADGILAGTNPTTHWQPVIGVAGGVAFSTNPGQSQNFPITTPGSSQFYNYANDNATQSKGLFEVFLGAEHGLYSNWRIQPGIAYSQAGTYHVDGTLTQGFDVPSSDQFTYNYKVTARQLLAQAKLIHPFKQIYNPYFLLGLGASFNSASSYTTNIPALLISTREYGNNTSSNFSYRVGLGLDIDVYAHTRLGLAYRFSGLGNVALGVANIGDVAVSGTLAQSHMYANEVLVQLTYII